MLESAYCFCLRRKVTASSFPESRGASVLNFEPSLNSMPRLSSPESREDADSILLRAAPSLAMAGPAEGTSRHRFFCIQCTGTVWVCPAAAETASFGCQPKPNASQLYADFSPGSYKCEEICPEPRIATASPDAVD